jgi:hypothetical protein
MNSNWRSQATVDIIRSSCNITFLFDFILLLTSGGEFHNDSSNEKRRFQGADSKGCIHAGRARI